MERSTNETSCGSGASLTGVQFGKDLGELVKRMDVWSSQVENVLRDSTATTAFIRASAQEDVKEVMGRLTNLDAEDHFIRKVRDAQQEEIIKCEQQTNEIYRTLEDLHEHTTKLFQLKADREALISKSLSDITDKLSLRKQKVKALHEATGWYKRLLSLRCEYSDAVKFIFTNVDPRDPDRVFSFSIRLHKSTGSWTMVDCNPWVGASASFVETLNKNNELSRFVRSMRREFEVLAVRFRFLVK
ncbi:kinetochore protein SPC25 homolog [Physcomitrium patens]|uniref:Kinetochore protein SPC25 n=1 Tax=Physcomitrium patens TaxID=3218 RepID=A9SMZ5_PHYPA|nr:kinetochore protein Spc25-like [Physcomitrium patens]PNR58514.1 hypothetical protein PHYPA_005509 [Physcomitrium patens]|eukprot:XP_024369533.1 kinetochore protein Spc25-like [Physcomitrella patens]